MRAIAWVDPLREADPVLRAKAQTRLDNLGLAKDVDTLADQLRDLFEVRAPTLEQLTTPQELALLIQSIRKGVADNQRLTKFIEIANHLSTLI